MVGGKVSLARIASDSIRPTAGEPAAAPRYRASAAVLCPAWLVGGSNWHRAHGVQCRLVDVSGRLRRAVGCSNHLRSGKRRAQQITVLVERERRCLQ